MAEPGGHHMHRNSGEEQCGRVQVAQIVQAGMGGCRAGLVAESLYLLISLLISADTVGVERFASPAHEDKAAAVGPG
jgi:hypothetical protein